MCDSTRRSIGWWDCYHGEADRKGRGGPSVEDLEPYWLCGTALGAVLEAYWSLREGAGKAARAGRSSSPLCRPFPWAFSWLSVIRLEAVVTTDWRHDNDPNPSPELGPHHGLPLLLPRAAQHFSHPPIPPHLPTPTLASEHGPRAQPPSWDPGAGRVPLVQHLGVMEGRRKGGTHRMVAWEGTVYAIDCCWVGFRDKSAACSSGYVDFQETHAVRFKGESGVLKKTPLAYIRSSSQMAGTQ